MNTYDISLDAITDPTYQPRNTLEAAGIESLANSIAEIGLINPIVVRQLDEGYELVAGTRRWHACQMLGHTTITARVITEDSREAAMLQFSENFHRQDLDPMQYAHMLKFMLDDIGYSVAEIAKLSDRGKDWVSKTLTLLDLDETTQAAIASRSLSPSVAHELRLIPDQRLRSAYIEYAIQGGCTEKAARDWARQAKATIAARNANLRRQEEAPEHIPQEPEYIPQQRKCTICGAPDDVVVLESWDVCWHCSQKLQRTTPDNP